jgi:hypothetical protein
MTTACRSTTPVSWRKVSAEGTAWIGCIEIFLLTE